MDYYNESRKVMRMASSLRNRLNLLKQTGAAPAAPQRVGGLITYAHTQPMPEGLYAPAPEALRRMGWNGRPFDIEKCLFLDTETTGLSGGAGTVAFLVGAGYVRRGRMTVEQFFMRDYSDEPDLLYRLRALMEQHNCVVTFNGRTFDMPLLQARFVMNRMRDYPELFNLDLLSPTRRAWKMRIESCRLSNVEQRILGLNRENDLPGAQVPERYFQYLKTGDLSLVEDIIAHNRQDILSLGLLLDKLLQVYAAPEKQTSVQDLFSLGKVLERQGESAGARALYRLSAAPRRAISLASLREKAVAGQANMRLVRLSLRNGDVAEARETLERMLRRGQMGAWPHVELAKIFEHRIRNFRGALEHTRQALALAPPEERPALEKREARLLDKIEKQRKETMQ